MQFLENLRSHLWLTLYFYWAAQLYTEWEVGKEKSCLLLTTATLVPRIWLGTELQNSLEFFRATGVSFLTHKEFL